MLEARNYNLSIHTEAIELAVACEDLDRLVPLLTVRQRHFSEEYIIDFNGKAAAIRAGYAPSYADRQASQLLKNVGVAYYVHRLSQTKESQIVSVDPDYIIKRITDIISKEGAKDGDKLRGLELLARHLGMFVERTEITGRDGEAIRYQEIENEAAEFAKRLATIGKRSNHTLHAVK